MSTSTIDPNNIDPTDNGSAFAAAVKAEFANAKLDLEFQTTIYVGSSHTTSGTYSSITGGLLNTVSANYAHVGGGSLNLATGVGSFIGGGSQNTSTGVASVTCGGTDNDSTGENSFVGAGYQNRATGVYSAVLGGEDCLASGTHSVAMGDGAKSELNGQFTACDTSAGDYSNTVDTTHTWLENSFHAKYVGGVYFASQVNPSGVPSAGAQLVSGSNAWATLSDKNQKKNFKQVDHIETVRKIEKIDVTNWSYKADQDPDRNYLGWMSQDFHKAFNLGGDKLSIDTQQNLGVLMSAVKGLTEMYNELKKSHDELLKSLK